VAKKRAFFSFDFDEDQNLKHHMEPKADIFYRQIVVLRLV